MMGPMLGMVQQLGAVAFSMQLGEALAGPRLRRRQLVRHRHPAHRAAAVRHAAAQRGGVRRGPGPVGRRRPALPRAPRVGAPAAVRPRVVAAPARDRRCRGVRPRHPGRPVPAGRGDGRGRHVESRGAAAAHEQRPPAARGHRRAAGCHRPPRDAAGPCRGLGRRRRRQAIADRLPSAVQLRETMRRRRAAGGPAEKTFATLVGHGAAPAAGPRGGHAVRGRPGRSRGAGARRALGAPRPAARARRPVRPARLHRDQCRSSSTSAWTLGRPRRTTPAGE